MQVFDVVKKDCLILLIDIVCIDFHDTKSNLRCLKAPVTTDNHNSGFCIYQ